MGTSAATETIERVLVATSLPIPTATFLPTSTPIPTFPPEGENRGAYKVIDLSSYPTYAKFLADYELALKQNAKWVRDPLEVVIHFRSLYLLMGKVEPETGARPKALGVNPKKTNVDLRLLPFCGGREYAYLPAALNKAIILVIEHPCDDSVGPVKLRVELHRAAEGIWAIDWLGSMWKCARGKERLKNFWHTTPCP